MPQQGADKAIRSGARLQSADLPLGPESTVEDLAAILSRDCHRLRATIHDVRSCGTASIAGIATQIEDARALVLAAVGDAMRIVHATDFAVRKLDLVMHHIPSARPHRIDYRETLFPRVSAFLIEHNRIRTWTRMACDLAWLLGATVCYLLFFDVHSAA